MHEFKLKFRMKEYICMLFTLYNKLNIIQYRVKRKYYNKIQILVTLTKDRFLEPVHHEILELMREELEPL